MTSLVDIVQQYQLRVEGIDFWVPYWINESGGPYYKGAPYKGKGTPGQLLSALKRGISTLEHQPHGHEGYRQAMRQLGLGVDCSGFVYHVLDIYLRRQRQVRLRQVLVLPKDDIITAATKPSWQRAGVSLAEVQAWPGLVSMDMVCRRFHKSPRMLTSVARLVDPAIADNINRADQIQPGDLIKMTGRYGNHLAIVVEITPDRIIYADSKHQEGGLGGVGLKAIQLSKPALGLEHQAWSDQAIFQPGKGDKIWRLKILTRG